MRTDSVGEVALSGCESTRQFHSWTIQDFGCKRFQESRSKSLEQNNLTLLALKSEIESRHGEEKKRKARE